MGILCSRCHCSPLISSAVSNCRTGLCWHPWQDVVHTTHCHSRMRQSTMRSGRHPAVSWFPKPQESQRVPVAIPVLLVSGAKSKSKLGSPLSKPCTTRADTSFARSGTRVAYPTLVCRYFKFIFLCNAARHASTTSTWRILTWVWWSSPQRESICMRVADEQPKETSPEASCR